MSNDDSLEAMIVDCLFVICDSSQSLFFERVRHCCIYATSTRVKSNHHAQWHAVSNSKVNNRYLQFCAGFLLFPQIRSSRRRWVDTQCFSIVVMPPDMLADSGYI